MRKITLEQFEGPLDLLLQLIEKNELKITEISLAKVTDQFLHYIDQTQGLASEEVADFLLIASKLIYIKSKHLLPQFEMEDDVDAGSLEQQLKIYRQYYEASKVIMQMWNDKKSYSFDRAIPYKIKTEGFVPPKNTTLQSLAESFAEVLGRIERIVNLPKAVIAKAVSISEKIKHIKDLIKQFTKFNFKEILKEKSKTEVIVGFLAMLELVKQREITVNQSALFADLNIERTKEINF